MPKRVEPEDTNLKKTKKRNIHDRLLALTLQHEKLMKRAAAIRAKIAALQ